MSDSHADVNHANGRVNDLNYAMRREFTKEMVAAATPGGKPAARSYKRKAYTHRNKMRKLQNSPVTTNPPE